MEMPLIIKENIELYHFMYNVLKKKGLVDNTNPFIVTFKNYHVILLPAIISCVEAISSVRPSAVSPSPFTSTSS